jgi:cardiolipin synthase
MAWDDFMVRFKHPKLNSHLWSLVNEDIQGSCNTQTLTIDDQLTCWNWRGGNAKPIVDQIKKRLNSAKKLRVFSPYISWPILDEVIQVKDHLLLQPKQNNKAWIQKLYHLPRYAHLQRMETDGVMNHMKFMIIDDTEVVFGSSNFDAISIFFEDEILVRSTEPGLVSSFIDLFESLIP